MESLGLRLATLRTAKDLSQAELGKILNIAQSTIAMYEKNNRKPDIDTLAVFAKFFRTTTDYLIGLTADPELKDQNYKVAESTTNYSVFKTQLAANMEAERGEAPSDEMLDLAERIYKKVLDEIKEEEKIKNK